MPRVTGRSRLGLVAAGLAIAALGGAPALAASSYGPGTTTVPVPAAAPQPGPLPNPVAKAGPRPARLSLHVHGVHHGKVLVGRRARAIGYLRPFVAGQRVRVKLLRRGHVVQNLFPKAKKVKGRNAGRFKFRSPALIKPGSYRILAQHDRTARQEAAIARSKKYRIRYPDLDPGDRSSAVRLFNRLLLHEGYYTTHGKRYNNRTEFAVMAFRKVNGMHRTFNADPGIFKKLAAGRGSFHLNYPHAGKHVEVDISRQVMVLANHGKAQYTFHVSTGAPATPTIRGHYAFYRRQPGFNSEGMYYSVYWHGGYAIHGYHSVPPYPASHGCVRNEIPESIFIYNWVKLGMSIYVYG
jgi:L,D-transpeptidase catalytic domain